MEYANNLLQNAVASLLENHKDEIISKINIDIKYEEIRNEMEIQSVDLLYKINHYIRNTNDTPEVIVEKLIKIFNENGIHDNVVNDKKKYNMSDE